MADVSLDVPAGAFFGLVGPNGAGKSTTLKMTTGLLRPDTGQAVVAGVDVWAEPVKAKRHMGVLPEDLRLFDRLSGRELLTFNGLLRGMDEDVVTRRAEDVLDVLGLTDAAGQLVIDYSQGMRKKIALGCAILHAPQVLFLDEPFESVDPVSARTIRTVLEHYTDSGATVVFSSHVMETVERLCDRVAIMHRGRLVAQGSLDDVRGDGSLEDSFIHLVGADAVADKTLPWLEQTPPASSSS